MKRRGRNEGGISFLATRGVYVVSVYEGLDEKGKPIYRKVQRKKKTDATAALAQLKADIASGKPKVKAKHTVGSWLDEWLEGYIKPNRAPKTYRSYEQMIRLHIKPKLGRVELRKLDPHTVSAFLGTKAKDFAVAAKDSKKLSRSIVPGQASLHNVRAVLRAATKRAVALGYMSYCPVNEATAMGKVERKPTRWLTPEETAQLYNALAGSPVESLVRFVLATGLRVGEATGLLWSGVDFERGVYRIENQLQRVDKEFVLRRLKTDMSRRELPLTGFALEAVKAEHIKAKFRGTEPPLGLVFLNPDGKPFEPKYVDTHLKLALTKAGLHTMGMHGLRHGAATTMLQSGVPIHVVSRMLGHSTITLTANTYGHVLQQAQSDASKTLDDAIRKHIGS